MSKPKRAIATGQSPIADAQASDNTENVEEAICGLVEDLRLEIKYLESLRESKALTTFMTDARKARWDAKMGLAGSAYRLLAHQIEHLQQEAVCE
ncbi:MAG: hypothetical protein KJ579_02670 [Verrucomicrobia bacterium]|nr:hypothetical protein [Verrucomicrobiota bacterium]